MTKEQETIKYIETRIKICNENADICDDNNFDEEATHLREESYMLETVLSMLKEKDVEIENKDKQIDLMLDEYEYNARINLKDYCDEELRKNTCIEDCKLCIKQYFERRAKDD